MYVKLCKLFVGVFLLYNTWYSQIWGANQLILYVSVGLSIVFMLLDVTLVLGKLNIRQINPLVKMYILFGVYALLTGLLVAIDKEEFVASMFTYMSFTLIVFEVWYISFRTGDFKWILDYLYILALLCAVTTMAFGQDYKTEVVVTTMSKFNNPNTLGVLMVFGIFTVVFQKDVFNKHFVLKYMSVFAFLYVILLCGSRKALFAGAGLFVFWVVEYFIEHKKEKNTLKTACIVITIIASLIGAIVYIVNVYVGMSGFERLLLLFTEDGTTGRMQMMQMAVDYWKDAPIFGLGFDQFKVMNSLGFYSHSTYAEVLSCTGIVGCLLFFVPLLKLLAVAVKKSFQKSENVYKIRICLLMLGVELFLGAGQIFVYSVTHMIVLFLIANVVYEEIGCGIERERVFRIKWKFK